MGYLWVCRGLPMGYLWDTRGKPMGYFRAGLTHPEPDQVTTSANPQSSLAILIRPIAVPPPTHETERKPMGYPWLTHVEPKRNRFRTGVVAPIQAFGRVTRCDADAFTDGSACQPPTISPQSNSPHRKAGWHGY